MKFNFSSLNHFKTHSFLYLSLYNNIGYRIILFIEGGGQVEVNKKSSICLAMKKLLKEQKIISGRDMEFQFICMSKETDTIPFMLIKREFNKPFTAYHKGVETPYFRLEKIDEEICCAVLSLLVAVDMDGTPVDSDDDFYALRKTKSCIIVNLNCFCAINPLPPELVNRPLPIIEPKK